MSDEDLGNISIGGERHVSLADQIQPRPAQVVRALTVSGEIDGTVQDGFLVNPSAVLIATPAPAAHRPPRAVSPTF